MSLEVPHITVGRKIANTLAGSTQLGVLLGAVVFFPAVAELLGPHRLDFTVTLIIVGAVACVMASVIAGQVLVRAGLGRYRTAGSLAHYSRTQIASIGAGLAIGIVITAFAHKVSPAGLAASIMVSVAVLALSLLVPLWSSRHESHSLDRYPGAVVFPATIIAHWEPGSSARMGARPLSVVAFTDSRGGERYVMHRRQRRFTGLGIMGEVHVHERHPYRPRFLARSWRATGRRGHLR